MNGLYLILDGLALLGPLALSFDKKVAFYKSWKPLFLAIVPMAVVFILWDIAFTKMGVWGFNPDYLSGIYIYNLPIEECLFFIVVPYACIFIYACLEAYVKKDLFKNSHKLILWSLTAILFAVGLIHLERAYTSITFISTAVFLVYFLLKKSVWLSRFLLAYLVSLIPFFIMNGVLTGSWIKDEVVWYNSTEILNIRLGTIPIEDSIYCLLMLIFTFSVFFRLRQTK